jgi:hypothetical protein
MGIKCGAIGHSSGNTWKHGTQLGTIVKILGRKIIQVLHPLVMGMNPQDAEGCTSVLIIRYQNTVELSTSSIPNTVCRAPISSITRDEIKSQDEINLKEMKERIKLVFSPKLVLTGVSSAVLDLSCMRLYLYRFSYGSSNQALSEQNLANLVD